MCNTCNSKHARMKHKTELRRSRPNKVSKSKAIKIPKSKLLFVKQVFKILILLKNWKYWIKVDGLNSKSINTCSWCGGSQSVKNLKSWRSKHSRFFRKDSYFKIKSGRFCFPLSKGQCRSFNVEIQKIRVATKTQTA